MQYKKKSHRAFAPCDHYCIDLNSNFKNLRKHYRVDLSKGGKRSFIPGLRA